MQMFDNINTFVKDDLKQEIRAGSKVSIAAACFSIYAYQELKEQLSEISELRFIFTSPTFTTERAPKEKRESAPWLWLNWVKMKMSQWKC